MIFVKIKFLIQLGIYIKKKKKNPSISILFKPLGLKSLNWVKHFGFN